MRENHNNRFMAIRCRMVSVIELPPSTSTSAPTRAIAALWHRMGAEALADALTLRGIDTQACIAELPQIVRTYAEHAADVLVLPALSGRAPRGMRYVSVTAALRSVDAQVVVLLPTANAQQTSVLLAEGAAACVTFDDGVDALADAIRATAHGEHAPAPTPIAADGFDRLSARERKVLLLVAEGCTNAQIAERIGVSVRTAENSRAAVSTKLEIHGRSAFFEYALEHGLIR